MTKWEEIYGPVFRDPQKIVPWSIRVSSTMTKPEEEELSELINQVSSVCDDYETYKLCLMSILTMVEMSESKFFNFGTISIASFSCITFKCFIYFHIESFQHVNCFINVDIYGFTCLGLCERRS